MADTPASLVLEVQRQVRVAQADALTELNRRHLQMWVRANPFSTVLPADLTIGGASSTLKIDEDLLTALVSGAVATFLREQGEGDPATLEALFQAACEEQLRRNRLRKAEETGEVQSMLDQIRQALGDVSEGDALEVLNQRYLQMWRRAHRDALLADYPAKLTTATLDAAVLIDTDLQRGLVDGAVATFLRRRGQNPDALEATFAADASEYARRVHRSSSSGPDLILLP